MTYYDGQESVDSLSPIVIDKITKKIKLVVLIYLCVLVILNFFILPYEPHFRMDSWPGFWAVFGVVVAIILGRVAKGAAHSFLGKNEGFFV